MNAAGLSFDGNPARVGQGSKGAFTLIELLAVLGILGVLAVISVAAFSTIRENAGMTRCAGNLRNISQAISLYASDNNCIPSVVDASGITWDASLLPYVETPAVFHCPADREVSVMPGRYPRTYSANGGVAYGVSPEELPFGSFWKDPVRRLASLNPGGRKLILIGERPGDDAVNRGFVGEFAFCSIDVIPATLHRKGRGGLYLLSDFSVEYLAAEEVARENYWYPR